MPPAVSESNLCRFMRAGSPSEERPIEPSGLRRGQAWLREHVDHFICQVPLPRGKRRRVAVVPPQPRTDVRIEPHLLARDLVGAPVKLADLVQQRLELPLVDRHNRLEVSSLNEPLAHPPLVLPPASGCGENLDRHWLISDRARIHRRATWCALARHLDRLENRGPARCILAYPPEGAASAYSSPDGKLPARRLILDVAVGKSKKQNRRRRNSMSVPANDELRGFPFIDTLDVDDLLLDPSDHPEHAVPTKRLAHRRDASRE